MKQPSLDLLIEKVESKYELAVVAAKRARAINESGHGSESSQTLKPVTIALQEIAEDQLVIERIQKKS
jgi:DNA-directed RNA polymerase subunit omega